MNLNYHFSSKTSVSSSSQYILWFYVIITWTWFLVISGNPSSKCQRVWLQIRWTRVQDFLSKKLQVCKVLGGVSSIIQVVHLEISMETYITCDFPRGWGCGPPAFIRIRTCFFFKTFFTYLRIFSLCVKPLYTAI